MSRPKLHSCDRRYPRTKMMLHGRGGKWARGVNCPLCRKRGRIAVNVALDKRNLPMNAIEKLLFTYHYGGMRKRQWFCAFPPQHNALADLWQALQQVAA